ncbi:MAG TPA: MBOAT family O-acyltransferase [Kofleriaceae bacterium]|nr:MBOAT family O-acyltransferase [Kofleriaceae bacterium]
MLFSDGDYPLFLTAVFLLYALTRIGRGWGLAARVALMTIFADAVFALITKNLGTIWDPIGGSILQLTIREGDAFQWAPVWHYALGALLLGGSVAGGARYADAIASPRGQAWIARGFAAVLAILGSCVLFYRDHLGDLTAPIAQHAHLVFLAILGVAIGSSIGRPRAPLGRLLILFLVSCLFYHAWAIGMVGAYKYLLLLILAIVVLDYHLALWIERTEDELLRKTFLVISICSNLGVLALFKYTDFFIHDVLRMHDASRLNLILPAGISFHTFQSLSYTIDVYRKQLKATTSVVQFATFVMFFPQLVAGPIVRAEELLPQLADPPPHDHDRAADGFYRIMVGLFKKVGINDLALAPYVDNIFKYPDRFSSVEVLVGVYAYAFQIYLDFSAYSDIAIGSAQVLGFTLPENFRTPYRSANLQEFWRRWHMSLSRWLRDYLYIPLGGSRGGELFTYRNLILTMLLGGLWHGARWTFIVWGALHGGGLAVTRVFQRKAARAPETAARTLGTLAGVAFVGGTIHYALFREIESPWFHLAFAWAYLTPLWAALTAWLSLDEDGPPVHERPRLAAAFSFRVLGCAFALALGAVLIYEPSGKMSLALGAIGGALAAACVADVLDVGPDRARATLWLTWAGKRALAIVLTFHYVCLAWVFFRATTFANAHEVLSRIGDIFSSAEHDHPNVSVALVIALAASVASHFVPNRTGAWLRESYVRLHPVMQGSVLGGATFALRALHHAQPKIFQFIYFQF